MLAFCLSSKFFLCFLSLLVTMWSSRSDDHGNRVSSSSSKSLSSSPSSSHSSILRNPRRKTMEEVWNNINLTCLHHSNSTPTPIRVEEFSPLPKAKTTSPTFPIINNLQEFLARPFNKDTQTQKQQQARARTLIPRFSTTQVHPPPAPPPPPPVPVSAAVHNPIIRTINLNSICDQQFPYMDDNNDEHHPLRPNPRLNHNNLSFIDSTSFVSALNTSHPFDQAFGNSSLVNNKRKPSDDTDDNMNCTEDRRHKRLIKNRESAARSRARKQACANELELEVANLMEENAMLRRQQKQLHLAAAAHQLPKKTTLQRTSTAPF